MTACLGMPIGDASVDAFLIICAVARERDNGTINLIEQRTDLRAVVNIVGGQRRRDDLTSVGINTALVRFDGSRGMAGCTPISLAQALPMPHKHNAAHRHHIPKMPFKVQNWPAYEAGLRQRGSLTLRIEDGALEDWQTCGLGGQARYTDAAIQTSLMLRSAFKLPLWQTEGLMASVLKLMDLTISAPDHTTVSRRWCRTIRCTC
jgi:hypothetical protein